MPFAIWGLSWMISRILQPLDDFKAELAQRGSKELQPILTQDYPLEIIPTIEEMNSLFGRISAAQLEQRQFIADAAHELGIPLMGENALAGELYGEQGWQQIAHALRRTPGFGGITFLRMQNFFDENRTPRERLQWLINQFQ